MKFSELMDLPFDLQTNKINIESILTAIPHTPHSVAEQVYSDFGRSNEYQSAYRNVDISKLSWEIANYPASEICNATIKSGHFEKHVNNVEGHIELFSSTGWYCISRSKKIVEYWSKNSTWITPPVLVQGSVMKDCSNIHLIEGHTRVGVLRGLVNNRLIAANSMHMIWLGKILLLSSDL